MSKTTSIVKVEPVGQPVAQPKSMTTEALFEYCISSIPLAAIQEAVGAVQRAEAYIPYYVEYRSRLTQKEWDAFCRETFNRGRRAIDYWLVGGNPRANRKPSTEVRVGKQLPEPMFAPTALALETQQAEPRIPLVTTIIDPGPVTSMTKLSTFAAKVFGDDHASDAIEDKAVKKLTVETRVETYHTIRRKSDAKYLSRTAYFFAPDDDFSMANAVHLEEEGLTREEVLKKLWNSLRRSRMTDSRATKLADLEVVSVKASFEVMVDAPTEPPKPTGKKPTKRDWREAKKRVDRNFRMYHNNYRNNFTAEKWRAALAKDIKRFPHDNLWQVWLEGARQRMEATNAEEEKVTKAKRNGYAKFNAMPKESQERIRGARDRGELVTHSNKKGEIMGGTLEQAAAQADTEE